MVFRRDPTPKVTVCESNQVCREVYMAQYHGKFLQMTTERTVQESVRGDQGFDLGRSIKMVS